MHLVECSAGTAGNHRKYGGTEKETYGVPIERSSAGDSITASATTVDTDIALP
jgi:hypothetical protein